MNFAGTWRWMTLFPDCRPRCVSRRARWVWHTPQEFDRLFGNAARIREEVGDNEVKDFALKLLVKAHEMEASDIHITNHGHYAQIDFRCLGMLQAYERSLSGEFARTCGQCAVSDDGDTDGIILHAFQAPGRTYRQPGFPAGRRVFPSVFIRSRSRAQRQRMARARLWPCACCMTPTHATGTLDSRLTALGFLPEQRRIFERLSERSGLVVISGPTGHGKIHAAFAYAGSNGGTVAAAQPHEH